MALLLNLGGFSLDLDAPSGSGSSSSSNWLYLGAYDNGVSYNTSDVVLYNGGLWYCYTSANLSAGYPPDSRPECWVQVSSTNFAGLDLTGITFNPGGSYGDITITGDLYAMAIQAPSIIATYITDNGGNRYFKQGDNADFASVTVNGTNIVSAGDNVSEFYNDVGYITGNSWPNFYGVVGWGGWDGNVSSLNQSGAITVGSFWYSTLTPIALLPDGSASFASGAATIDTSGILSIGNSVSSSTDNSVDSKVEIVINGTTYYLLASTSAS